MKYKYVKGMREISGFGGGYEKCCRDMVISGVKWFDEHPNANPKFHHFDNVMGLIIEDNDDAKELSEVMNTAAKSEATGAMMQACTMHVLWIRANGWDKYVTEMKSSE